MTKRGDVDDDFEAFFMTNYRPVLGSLALALGDRSAAEDAAQEAFAHACRRWRTVSRLDRPGTWVYVVALRHGRRARARDDRRPAFDSLVPEGTDAVDVALDLAGALQRLPQRQREAVVLRYLADLTIDEVARVMRCAPGTVKSTLHAALERLRVDNAEVTDAR